MADGPEAINDNFTQLQKNIDSVSSIKEYPLTGRNGWSVSGSVYTFKIGNVPFWSIAMSCKHTNGWSGGNNPEICNMPDIGNDADGKNLAWRYATANNWNVVGLNIQFAFHDGAGYLNIPGGKLNSDNWTMVFTTQPFV